MTRQDWIDYFEAINGREPSQEELTQALLAGEYREEGHQTAPVVEEVQPSVAEPTTVVPPVQAQSQAVVQNQQQTVTPVNISQGQQVNGQQVYNVSVAVPTAYTSFLSQF